MNLSGLEELTCSEKSEQELIFPIRGPIDHFGQFKDSKSKLALSLSAQIKTFYKRVAPEMFVDIPATTWLEGITKLIKKQERQKYKIQIE